MTCRDAANEASKLENQTSNLEEHGGPLRFRLIEDALRDVIYSCRNLRRSPSFTLAAVLTLALAIAANASIFAVVERVVLNPLPYPDSDRLIQLDHGFPSLKLPSGVGMTVGLYYQYSDRAHRLDGVAIYRTDELTLTGAGEPERIRVTSATTTLVSVLRVRPQLGRWFTDQEAAVGAPQVAVMSHAMWMTKYGGDLHVLGRSMTLNGVPTEIVGVMPASFAFPDPRVDAWIVQQIARTTGFGLPFRFLGVARLRDGATLADARTELNSLIADLPKVYPGDRGVAGNVGVGETHVGSDDNQGGDGWADRACTLDLVGFGRGRAVNCMCECGEPVPGARRNQTTRNGRPARPRFR